MAALWSGFRGGRLRIDLIVQLLLGTLAYRRPRQRRPDLDLSEIISCFPRRLLRKFFNPLSDSSGAPGNYCHMGVLKW
jgi:hypothetical protein